MTFISIFIGFALALVGALVLLRFVGFKSQRPEDYTQDGPQFDLRRDMSGPLQCEGVIYGPFGRVTSRFVATMEATWTGNTGVMTEVFHYSSGAIQHRQWKLKVGNDGSVQAEADDLHGVGTGQQAGSAVQLNYSIELTKDAGGHVLDVTDWMYLMDNGTIMNRSQFRKFGIKVAELVATMRPMPKDQIAAE